MKDTGPVCEIEIISNIMMYDIIWCMILYIMIMVSYIMMYDIIYYDIWYHILSSPIHHDPMHSTLQLLMKNQFSMKKTESLAEHNGID